MSHVESSAAAPRPTVRWLQLVAGIICMVMIANLQYGWTLFVSPIDTWGEIYSLFPSTCTDVYGSRYATTNAGMLYTAKGTASLLVPLANVLAAASGGWHVVFIAAALMNAVAAVMALAVLKPLRAAHDKGIDEMRSAQVQHP
jgi:hypothetical protein